MLVQTNWRPVAEDGWRAGDRVITRVLVLGVLPEQMVVVVSDGSSLLEGGRLRLDGGSRHVVQRCL